MFQYLYLVHSVQAHWSHIHFVFDRSFSVSLALYSYSFHVRPFVSILLARRLFIAYVWVEPHLSLASHPGVQHFGIFKLDQILSQVRFSLANHPSTQHFGTLEVDQNLSQVRFSFASHRSPQHFGTLEVDQSLNQVRFFTFQSSCSLALWFRFSFASHPGPQPFGTLEVGQSLSQVWFSVCQSFWSLAPWDLGDRPRSKSNNFNSENSVCQSSWSLAPWDLGNQLRSKLNNYLKGKLQQKFQVSSSFKSFKLYAYS